MDHLERLLDERAGNGSYRKLSVPVGEDFFSNDYLGLARSKELWNVINQEFESLGFENRNGATGSRLLSGNSEYIEELERYLSDFFQTESALILNSGYNANLAFISSVPQKGDTIIYDELIHASLKEGARLSFAKRFSFRHNDLDDLKKKIEKSAGNIYVCVESVYSMDGDTAPLSELAGLCESTGAYLVVDEAHSTGIFGRGKGLVSELGLERKVFARIHTFGKAMGVHGACIAGPKVLKEFLINFGRAFIYTTALPLHSLVSIRKSFEFLKEHPLLPGELFQKIRTYNKQADFDSVNNSPVQVVSIPGNENAVNIANHLIKEGFEVRPILSPTVKKGQERIRICLHRFNSDQKIAGLLKEIKIARTIIC